MDLEKKQLEALKKGSYKAFTAIYSKYAKELYGFAFNLTKLESLTQDIVQESFIKIWTHRQSINTSLSFKSYLFTIARHSIISYFRKQINQPNMMSYIKDVPEPASNTKNADVLIDFECFSIRLQQAKEKLSKRQSTIFQLCREDGLSVSEVAKELSITEQSVRNQLSLATKILRKELVDFAFLFTIMFHNI